MSHITPAPITTPLFQGAKPLNIAWAIWLPQVFESLKKAEIIQVPFQGALNSALVNQVLLLAHRGYQVTAIREIHAALGTDSGDVTVQATKDSDTDAPGAGKELLQSALSLKTDINDDQSGPLTLTVADRQLNTGDRLSLKFAGVLTSVSGVNLTVELRVI